MELTSAVLDMDWAEVDAKIVRFIRDYVRRCGAKGIILGLSGGVDSCTVAVLSARALGGNHVLGLMLPEAETRSERDLSHASLVAKEFKFKTKLCDITSYLEAFYRSMPVYDPLDRICRGNVKARTRMVYIYYFANKLNLLVCGCSDKSEVMMGYFTKWGDVAADISPIMDLYKTQVRKLAQHLGLPTEVIIKPSSPALWPGQTAEGELGMSYNILDLVLCGLEHFMTTEEIAQQLNIETQSIERVKQRWLQAEHKRRMPLTTKLEYRTVGIDFRLKRG